MKLTKISYSSTQASIVTRVFPGSWFSKFKQRDSNPENHPLETRRRGKLDFPGPCLILHPQLGEVGFCGADCDEEDDDDDDDAYWRISFNGNHLEGNHCTGGIKPLCHDSDEASQVSVLSFNTCLSCNEMKQMKGKRNCGDITLGENGSVFGRKKPIQEAQLSTPRQKDVARPSSREMCSRLERKRGDKSIKWPAERDGSSVIDSDSQNQQNEQILDQFTDPDKEDSNSSQHRASVSQEQSLGDKNFNAEKAHKKFSYRRRHSRSRKIKHNAGNSFSQTDCNTRVLSERKKARMKLKREQKARVKHGKTMYDSYAVVKSSIDPRQDFRDSVAEMIREKGIKQPEELEGLLASYLTLNCDGHHDLIIKVFLEVCFELNKDAC